MTETVYEKIQAGTINIAREVRRVDFPPKMRIEFGC